MKKIEAYVGAAPKLGGHGSIEYVLWVDSHGELFVQLVGNDDTGTFSRLAFSVKNYEAMRHVAGSSNGLKGRDLDTGETITVEDNNNAAFLRAALKDLLD